MDAFSVISEIEPPTTPDLRHVRHQIGVLSPISDSFLIPDNHLGRATVSSVAVAHEVQAMGGRSVACVNSRDRNLLGFQRDLLTAAAYGVDRFLFVGGDKPSVGAASRELTVRAMIEEARASVEAPAFQQVPPSASRPACRGPCLDGRRPPTSRSCRSATPWRTSCAGARATRSTCRCTPGSWS